MISVISVTGPDRVRSGSVTLRSNEEANIFCASENSADATGVIKSSLLLEAEIVISASLFHPACLNTTELMARRL